MATDRVRTPPAGPETHNDRAPLDASRSVHPSDLRVLVALCSGTFLASLITLAPPPFFPAMARDLHVGVPVLGQIMTAMLLLSALLGLLFGPLSDSMGYRRLILAGLGTAIATLLIFGLAPAFQVLILASVSGAVTTAAVPGPSLALAGTYFPGLAGQRAVSYVSGTAALAAIVGVPGLAAIGVVASWRVAYVTVAGAAVVACIIAFLGLPHSRKVYVPPGVAATIASYGPLLRSSTMRRLYAARALSGACWIGLLTYLGGFLTDALALEVGHIGLVYMAGGAAFFLGSLSAGGLLARMPARMIVVAGYATMALLMGIAFSARFGVAGTVVLITAAALVMGLGIVSMAALFLAESPGGPGTTMTLSGSVFNLGSAAGGVIGGVLIALAGYDAVAIGLPALGFAAALFCRQSSSLSTLPPATGKNPESPDGQKPATGSR